MHSSSPDRWIVICGNDELLLHTRELVLETVGFRVKSVVGVPALARLEQHAEVSLVLLCHSLDVSGMEEAARVASARWPASKMLAITTPHRGLPWRDIASVDAFAGPLAMIEACRRLSGENGDLTFRVTAKRDDEIVGG